MKPLKNILILLCSLLLLSASCKKEKSENPIDDLPPATQTGANTFGCLVNGELFLPKGSGLGGPVLNAQYEFVDNKYYFSLLATRSGKDCKSSSILLSLNNLTLQNMKTYSLQDTSEGKAHLRVRIGIDCSFNTDFFRTNNNVTGNMNITYFNTTKNIVAGTFSFDAVNSKGEKVEVREGRFDMKL